MYLGRSKRGRRISGSHANNKTKRNPLLIRAESTDPVLDAASDPAQNTTAIILILRSQECVCVQCARALVISQRRTHHREEIITKSTHMNTRTGKTQQTARLITAIGNLGEGNHQQQSRVPTVQMRRDRAERPQRLVFPTVAHRHAAQCG